MKQQTQHGSMAQNPELIARSPRIVILIPCHNEGQTIFTVVADFAAVFPDATVYVYDNNSTDDTKTRAAAAGAIVRSEPLQGKGNVIRRMFADIEADVYVLVDGDGTYDAQSAKRMVECLLKNCLDMVNAARVPATQAAFRRGHLLGNKLLASTVAIVFGTRIRDMLSGYRVFSRRFVKSFPALASGFETETELTVHALDLRLPVAEVQTPYRPRVSGSTSKLRTFRDGFRILHVILLLIKEERPLQFFSAIAASFATIGLVLGWPVVTHYLQTGLVPRLPTAILATGLVLLAFISFVAGLILDSVTLGRREIKRLHYLGLEGPDFATPTYDSRCIDNLHQ
jgi:glycosyltransferase involved in cell wall biosynthesis